MDQKQREKIIQEERKDAEEFNNGLITFEELQRRAYIRQQNIWLPKLLEHKNAGEWEQFIHVALCVYEVMEIAFKYYDEIPDNLKYKFAIDAYSHHGDSIPAVRKAIRGALKYGAPTLPTEIKDLEFITIYRAGEEEKHLAPFRISWSLKKEVALFFLNEWAGRHATHLYKGKIKVKDIIAYSDDREEAEIMQYNKVYDIEEIT